MSKQEMIEKYEEWEENAVLMFDAEFTQAHRDYASNAFKVAHEQQQAKIDELQRRVDNALQMLSDWDDQTYRDDAEQLIGELGDVLRGEHE